MGRQGYVYQVLTGQVSNSAISMDVGKAIVGPQV